MEKLYALQTISDSLALYRGPGRYGFCSLCISQRVSSSNKSTQFGSTKETLLKRLLTKMWAEYRETTKKGQCSGSERRLGPLPQLT